jgi:luciferase-like monooxygenase
MAEGADPVWEAFVELILPMGALREEPSRYGAKPAVYLNGREIAHSEAPGHIDLRITRGAWVEIRGEFADNSALVSRAGRRDWIELFLESPDDLIRLVPLISAAVDANR